jgi:hypothetical protein
LHTLYPSVTSCSDIYSFEYTSCSPNAFRQVEDVRFENDLSAKHLSTLYERAKVAYPDGRVDPEQFMQFACEQLGGKVSEFVPYLTYTQADTHFMIGDQYTEYVYVPHKYSRTHLV